MRKAWEDGAPRGRLAVHPPVRSTTDPESQAPEYLVCATAAAGRAPLVGKVLRNSANGLPRTVGEAVLTRPTARTIHLGFDPVGDPLAGQAALRGGERLARAALPARVGLHATSPRTPRAPATSACVATPLSG